MVIRVGIVDDHPSLIVGTTAVVNLQPDMQVFGTGATAQDLLAQRIRLDVVLLDLALSDGTTPGWNIRQLQLTRAQIIVYSAGDRPDLIRAAARAGARGMVRKSADLTALTRAIRDVARGGVGASADWAAALEGDDDFVDARLTERETEVLARYASGETAERVAAALSISRETVKDHLRRIRAKYAAADRAAPSKADLTWRAFEDGIVQREAPGARTPRRDAREP